MSLKFTLKLFALLIATVILQVLFPSISIYGNPIRPDLFLLYLTFIALRYGRFNSTVFGFGLGFVQDITTQIELLGIYSFIKSLTGYMLGTIFGYERVWSKQIRWLAIAGVYLLHFSIFYFVKLNGSSTSIWFGFVLVSVHTIFNLALLYLMNRILFDSDLV